METSPTGTPLIPQLVVRWLSLVTGVAGVAAVALREQIGHTTIAEKILAGVAGIGVYLVANSQGIRKTPTE